MAVTIRLTRRGKKKKPFYRVVVADERARRDGRIIESIGTYDPLSDPKKLSVKKDRFEYWTKTGARPSETVSRLMKELGGGSDANAAEAKPEKKKETKAEEQAGA